MLIIGIVLGAIHKIQRKDLAPAVWFGALSAVVVGILTAIPTKATANAGSQAA
ncbi:MAG: hypothetical protein HUU11_17530 [Anaerolineales bacterium]|nr:hypothetical protein [Anaerolineales bacterium]